MTLYQPGKPVVLEEVFGKIVIVYVCWPLFANFRKALPERKKLK